MSTHIIYFKQKTAAVPSLSRIYPAAHSGFCKTLPTADLFDTEMDNIIFLSYEIPRAKHLSRPLRANPPYQMSVIKDYCSTAGRISKKHACKYILAATPNTKLTRLPLCLFISNGSGPAALRRALPTQPQLRCVGAATSASPLPSSCAKRPGMPGRFQ